MISDGKKAIWLIKKDFRLVDNEALINALRESTEVLPIFVFEHNYISEPDISPMHVWAWQQAVYDLREQCRRLGGDVLVSWGGILKVLTNLRKKWPFETIYSHEETGNNWTFQRDLNLKQWCRDQAVEWIEYYQTGVVRRLKNREKRNLIIKKRLLSTAPLYAPSNLKFPQLFQAICADRKIPPLSQFFNLKNYPEIQWDQLQQVSETQAHQDLESFLNDRGKWYSGGISSPNTAFSSGSRLSVHLAWGTISLRYVFQRTYQKVADNKANFKNENTKRWARSLRAFESRLHWHDHFIQRLESSPQMEYSPLNSAYETLAYGNDPRKLEVWQKGMTGFPMIDACMRCLNATGFMNFRMRSMLVSFACYGLHLDWRVIHPHLARVFLDYEPGIHFAQLQMQAGVVGINTIRVYSPQKQIIDQDPECIFIKKWIPELRGFTAEQILNYESYILVGYPHPIVNFKEESKKMKDQVFAIRKSNDGIWQSKKVLKKHGSPKKRSPAKKNKDDEQLDLF